MSQSLPQALLQQSQTRGAQIALRYKQLGIWQTRSWSELAVEVSRLAGALHQKRFGASHDLLIISEARAEALLLALAAHWLGGSVSLLDPAVDNRDLLAALAPDFAVAEGLEAVGQLRSASPGVLIFLDKRGLSAAPDKGLVAYAALLDGVHVELPRPAVNATSKAFIFPSLNGLLREELSHRDLLLGARQLVDVQGLDNHEQALAARVFAASGQARYLLAPWLVAGFCLNFPEGLSTRDNDRRELGPTLVLGTRESYARLELWAREHQPLPGSLSHGLYRWAMNPSPGVLRRWLGHWLIRRPLLDVLGMSRLSKPLLVGEALTPQSTAFFSALGIQPRSLSTGANANVPADSPASVSPQPA
jgi:hypothetical protein